MKFLTDFFSSSSLEYPGERAGSGEGRECVEEPFQAPERTGFFERFFAPKEFAYPAPVCRVRQAEKYIPEARKMGGEERTIGGSTPPSSSGALPSGMPPTGNSPSSGNAAGWVLGGPQ